MNYRYPGSKPFLEADKSVFFGREEDIDNLFKYISVENLVVLYGKSGLGKTSLLNAGILPKLQQESNFVPFAVRFKNYVKGMEQSPLEIFSEKITGGQPVHSFLNYIQNEDITLWQYLKSIHYQSYNQSEKFKAIIFLDQFEELFTYPEAGVEEFVRQLADLINRKVPLSFKRALNRKMDADDELVSDQQMEWILQALDIKVVISIRSDRLSLLNRLKPYVPHILQNCYELRPLTRKQARDAIVLPAEERDNQYLSRAFTYSDSALNLILDFLTKNNEKNVESFQLQILCQYVERLVINSLSEDYITEDDIGDVEFIYKNYYELQVMEICTDKAEITAATRLIEEGLIFEEEERRVSLYEGQIRSTFGVSAELLDKLVDSHLIRAEPSSSGGYTYELSHDTLVAPILQAKKKRKEEESWVKAEEERRQTEEKRRKEEQQLNKQREEAQRRRLLIGAVVLLGLLVISLAVFLPMVIVKNRQLKEGLAALATEKSKSDSLVDNLEQKAAHIADLNSKLEILLKTEKGQLLDSLLVYKREVKKSKASHEELVKRVMTSTGDDRENAQLEYLKKETELRQKISNLENNNQELIAVLKEKVQSLGDIREKLKEIDNKYARVPLTNATQASQISQYRSEWQATARQLDNIIRSLEDRSNE